MASNILTSLSPDWLMQFLTEVDTVTSELTIHLLEGNARTVMLCIGPNLTAPYRIFHIHVPRLLAAQKPYFTG